MTLYEIDARICGIIDQLTDPDTGEINDEALTALDELQEERTAKLENIGLYIKNLSAEAKAIKAEEDALKRRRTTLENKEARLRAYLSDGLGGEVLKSARISVTYRKTPEAVKFENSEAENFFRAWADASRKDLLRYREPEIDKAAVKSAILAGEDIRFARLESGTSMIIK